MSHIESPDAEEPLRLDDSPKKSVDAAPSVAVVSIVSRPGPWFDASLGALNKNSYPNLTVFVLEVGAGLHTRRSRTSSAGSSHGSDTASLPGESGGGLAVPASTVVDASVDPSVDPSVDTSDTASRVKAAMPGAYFRSLRRHPGYSEAANLAVEVLGNVDYVIFAHDDVAPEPAAITQMVKRAESVRSNVVSPKYVDWNEPSMVRSIGGRFDATGKYVPIIETPELDQGQHDSRSAVMAAEGGFIMVRTEFFKKLKGFDKEITTCGEMLDFSWRAAVAGSQVDVVSGARVRYLNEDTTPSRNVHPASFESDSEDANPHDEAAVYWRRHRARTVLKTHRRFQFFIVFFLQLLVVVGEGLWGLIGSRRVMTTASIATITWNLARWRSLIRSKIELERIRAVKGADLRKSYTSVRRRWSEEFQAAWEQRSIRLAERNIGQELTRASRVLRRVPVLLSLAVAIVWVAGSRDLFSEPLAAIGRFMPLDDPINSLRRFFLVWPTSPMGEAVPSSPAHLLLALLGFVFFGATALVQKVLVLGAIPFGVWSVYRLARPLRTSGASFVAALAYALVPVPYDAISTGRFDVLVAYALAPLVVHRLLRLDGADPYLYSGGLVHVGLRRRSEDRLISPLQEGETVQVEAPRRRASDQRDEVSFVVLRRLLPLAALMAIAAAFSPQVLLAFAVVAFSLAITRFPLGSLPSRRLLAVTGGAIALACAMLLPAVLGNEGGLSQFWSTLTASQGLSTRDLLALSERRTPFNWFLIGIFLSALVAIAIGKAWRFTLSLRLWFVVFVLVVFTWLGSSGYLGGIRLEPGVWFAFISLFLALGVATSMSALVYDRMKSPPWWRALGIRIFITGCVAVSVIPLAFRASDGRWGMPEASVASSTSWMVPGAAAPLSEAFGGDSQGSFRTVWLGSAELIPGGARNLAGISGTITYNGPVNRSLAPLQHGGEGQAGVANALAATLIGESVDLGNRLRPYGVRYLAIPAEEGNRLDASILSDPQRLTESINQQLDMRQVSSDSNVRVWENTEWEPIVPASLTGDNNSRWRGELDAREHRVLTASSPSWRLKVDGQQVARGANVFGNTFDVPNKGDAQLDFVAPTSFAVGQVMVATLWFLVIGISIAYLPRRKRFA